jgi:hypothetical protein
MASTRATKVVGAGAQGRRRKDAGGGAGENGGWALLADVESSVWLT